MAQARTRTKQLPPQDAPPPDDTDELDVSRNVNGEEDDFAGEEEGPVEPYGRQVLKQLHKDLHHLMEYYDDVARPLDNEHVKEHLHSVLSEVEKHLTNTEKFHKKHYKDFDPLEGTMPEEEEMPAEEPLPGEMKDADTMGDPAVPADSAPAPEPTAEEVIEGMEQEPEQGEKRLKDKTEIKSLCPKCKSEGKTECKCAKALDGKAPVPLDSVQDHDNVPPAEQKQPLAHKAFDDYDKEDMTEAVKFLKALAEEREFGEEKRLEAHYHSKRLGRIGAKSHHFHRSLETADGEVEEIEPGTVGNKIGPLAAAGIGYVAGQMMGNKDGLDIPRNVNGEEDDEDPLHKACKAASAFLKSAALDKAFGDPHRQEAAYHAHALEPLPDEGDELGVSQNVDDMPPEEEIKAEPGTDAWAEEEREEEIHFEPGAMGQKDALGVSRNVNGDEEDDTEELEKAFRLQAKAMNELGKKLALVGKALERNGTAV